MRSNCAMRRYFIGGGSPVPAETDIIVKPLLSGRQRRFLQGEEKLNGTLTGASKTESNTPVYYAKQSYSALKIHGI